MSEKHEGLYILRDVDCPICTNGTVEVYQQDNPSEKVTFRCVSCNGSGYEAQKVPVTLERDFKGNITRIEIED